MSLRPVIIKLAFADLDQAKPNQTKPNKENHTHFKSVISVLSFTFKSFEQGAVK
jgi:hypothetical protein